MNNSTNNNPRQSVSSALIGLQTLSTFYAILFGIVLIIELTGLVETRKKEQKTSGGVRPHGAGVVISADVKYLRITLFLNTFWSFITFTMIAVQSYFVGNVTVFACDVLQRVYPSLCMY
jgi:hypothetical protein